MMILFLVLIASVSCFPENFRAIVKVDGKPVNVDFVLDLEKNTFVVTVGGVSHLGPTFSSTVNLHDFNMQKLAFKRIDAGICYVIHMDENLAELSTRLHNMTSEIFAPHLPTHVYRLTKTSMSNENLLAYAGSKIANFCRGYQTKYAHRVEDDEIHRRALLQQVSNNVVCGCDVIKMII
ncbi:uncharacterized protein LOC143054712 isoform X2 [Mytilus galloprovincialis]|uniref:uncharacterized protein LOC143054712 isoform X2 n=1 Tax=Mytilus galloprovincialis TaxID=29158 RepID=UPI003F7B7439